MSELDFTSNYKLLTGNPPFPWQDRLYRRFISDEDSNVPASCNLPTGLGKTSVVAVWLIALATTPQRFPRRLVYVVNRRTVVDQTTTEVEKYRTNLMTLDALSALRTQLGASCVNPASPIALSTLRGQFADNREWAADTLTD